MRPFSFAVLGAMLLVRAAHADPASDAKDLFERGRALRASGNCAEAAPLFEKAAAIFPSGLGSVRNAAECEEAVGHFATAHRLWLDLKRAVMLSKDAKYDGWQADAEAAASRLEPKLAHVTIVVTQTDGKVEGALSAGARADVTINDEPLPRELVGTVLDRDPGKYIVSVVGDGEGPKTQSFDLAVGDSKTLRFVVRTPVSTAALPPPTKPIIQPETPTNDGASTRRTVGWIGVGVGAAALVGAGISLGIRQSALGDLKAGCPNYQTQPCPASVQPAVSRGSTASILVDVLGIAGGVLAIGGLLLVVLSPSPRVPQVSVGIGSVMAQWSFE